MTFFGKSVWHSYKQYIPALVSAVRICHITGTHLISQWLLRMVSFRSLSSIRVYLLHLGSYWVQEQVYCGLRWFWKNSINVCSHDQAFSDSEYFLLVALCNTRRISASLHFLSPCKFFSWYLSIRPFWVFFSYICLQNYFASFVLDFGLSTCILHLLAGSFFRYFLMSFFVCISFTCFVIIQVSLLCSIYFDLSF